MDIKPPDPQPPNIAAACRLQQTLVIGLTAAVLAALAVAYVARQESPPPNQGQSPTLTWVAAIQGLIAIPIAIIAPTRITNSARRRIAQQTKSSPSYAKLSAQHKQNRLLTQLLPAYTTRIIINVAIFEGVAWIAVAAYFLDAHPIALYTAAAFTLAVFTQLPTQNRLQNWLDTQVQQIQSHTDP